MLIETYQLFVLCEIDRLGRVTHVLRFMITILHVGSYILLRFTHFILSWCQMTESYKFLFLNPRSLSLVHSCLDYSLRRPPFTIRTASSSFWLGLPCQSLGNFRTEVQVFRDVTRNVRLRLKIVHLIMTLFLLDAPSFTFSAFLSGPSCYLY